MSATIFVDASFCPKTRAAGWGAWVASDKGSAVFGGPITVAVNSSGEAELRALVEAIHVAKAEGYLEDAKFAVIQSDCLWALEVLRTWRPSVAKAAKPKGGGADVLAKPHMCVKPAQAGLTAFDAAVPAGITIWLRHVKGHTEGDGRQWLNARCDEIARKHMRAQRGSLA